MTDKLNQTDNFTIGIVAPISDSTKFNAIYTDKHWRDVQTLVKNSTEIEMNLVSESDEAGIIMTKIISNLANLDLIICDVSSKNANVMFELGLRLAFDKPIILIKDELTDYSFDTSPIKHLTYPSNLNYVESINFQEDLEKKIQAIKNGEVDSYLAHFKVQRVAKTLPEEEISEVQALHQELNQLFKEVKDVKNISLINSRRPRSLFPPKDVLKEFIEENFPNQYTLTSNMIDRVISEFDLQGFTLNTVKDRINIVLTALQKEGTILDDDDLPF